MDVYVEKTEGCPISKLEQRFKIFTMKGLTVEISTIQPSGYPNSGLPAHIHISMWKNGNIVQGVPGELLFEDDTRLTAERKQHALREGFIISKNTGTETAPVYNYQIKINN